MKLILTIQKNRLFSTFAFALVLQMCFTATVTAADSFNNTETNMTVQSITGKVMDADGEALIGVNVLVKGTDRGTITDIDGSYTIDANPGDVLVFSYVGFRDQEVVVGSEGSYNVTLDADGKLLEEVVVIGYGTQKKSHLTGAISKVSADDLEALPLARVDDALVGRVSGVNIAATEGEAGSAPTIRIRGTGSMVASSDPLIVVVGKSQLLKDHVPCTFLDDSLTQCFTMSM